MSIQEDDGSPASPRVSPQRDVLLALAERCEREEPNAELDWLIWFETAKVSSPPGEQLAYTTSLDAAVTLVPKGWWYRVGTAGANVGNGEQYATKATKPAALALCAAALRAWAALAGKP